MKIDSLRAYFDKLAAPMAVADQAGQMLEVNEAFCRYFGYSREELLSMSVFDYTHADDLERSRELFRQVADGKIDRFQYEKRYLRKDGTEVWAVVTTSWLTDLESGRPLCVGVIQDITPRVRAEQVCKKSEEFLTSLVDNVDLGIALIDETHTILKANRATARMVGKEPHEFQGKKCYRSFERREEVCLHCPGVRAMAEGRPQVVETEGMREDGSHFLVRLRAVPVFDADGRARSFIEVAEDITRWRAIEDELQQNLDRLNHLAHHDQLTGLPNRTLLYDRLKHAIDSSQRSREPLAVVVFDLDRFTKINKSLGFEVGNQVLREAGNRLQAKLRKADSLCRIGGTGFAMVLEKAGSLQRSASIARKILAVLSDKPLRVAGHELHLSASVGISHYPGDGDDVESLLRAAESARIKAREQGGNAYQYYRPEMEQNARHLLQMESQLHTALEQDQLTAYYQPQVNPLTGRIIGLEALVRWQHPERGLVSPAQFIPVAEETGLIAPLGRRVLEVACAQATAWQSQGLKDFRIAVNVSALQIARGQLVETVSEVLDRTGLAPRRLEIELTESALVNDPAAASRTLVALKEMGISLALDDFGTGYSALSYLKDFPIDRIKIAQDFVRNVPRSRHDAAIVEAVIALGKKLGIAVIAEGVETSEHLACMLHLGCTEIQGYLISRPLDSEAATAFLKTRLTTSVYPPLEAGAGWRDLSCDAWQGDTRL